MSTVRPRDLFINRCSYLRLSSARRNRGRATGHRWLARPVRCRGRALGRHGFLRAICRLPRLFVSRTCRLCPRYCSMVLARRASRTTRRVSASLRFAISSAFCFGARCALQACASAPPAPSSRPARASRWRVFNRRMLVWQRAFLLTHASRPLSRLTLAPLSRGRRIRPCLPAN